MTRAHALPLVLTAALAVGPGIASAQCNTAAFSLSASSYMDSQLNPPPGEDIEFFSSTGGVPTIYFLLDNSKSMRRLPPNGPGFYTSPLPPLNDVNCPAGGDVFDPSCKNQNVPSGNKKVAPPGVVGCGVDTVSGAYAGVGTAIRDILNRSFAPTCGKSLTAGMYNAPYQGAGTDYAHQASVCPYFKAPISSFQSETPLDGYDSDFYCGSNGSTTTCPTVGVNYFDKKMVFHESIADGSAYSGGGFNGTDTSFDPSVPPGNGWDHAAVYPFLKTDGKTIGSVDDFCAQLGTVTTATSPVGIVKTQGGQTLEAICKSCLTNQGFFFDGYAYRQDQEGLPNVLYASVWLTGNYLNFFPPKFIVARKALKDLLMNNLRVRAGIAVFGGGGTSCKTAATEIQQLNPTCNNVYDTKANLWSNRASFMTAINKVTFDGGTALAEALLNVAQQFRTPGLPWFDGTCTNSGFEPPSATNQQAICFPCQTSNIVVITDGRPKATDDVSKAFPQGSATSSAAAATCSSGPPVSNTQGCIGDTTLGVVPGPDKAACPMCQGTAAVGGPGGTSPFGPTSPDPIFVTTDKDYLNDSIRVAWLLNNLDFRRDDEIAFACNLFKNKQSVSVYTLGFGTNYSSDTTTLLSAVAKAGGGIFVNADNPAQLNDGFKTILLNIDTRATSFSVASVNALQATAGQSVIVPRFNPAKAAYWNGHLYRFELFSEFAAGCTPGGTGDLDCDCACTSVFLKDVDTTKSPPVMHFISEDAQGNFKRNSPDLPTCSPTNHCSSCGKPDPAQDATPIWDAADRLQKRATAGSPPRAWKSRAVYTAIDDPSAPDGKIDGGGTDPVVAILDTSTKDFDPTTLANLLPYLGLSVVPNGPCDQLGNALAAVNDDVGAAAVKRDVTTCEKGFLAFLMGADVLNANGNTASSACPFPPPSPGTDTSGNAIWNPLALCDRAPPNSSMLGDIFHSSPVRVLEPQESSDIFSAYNNQTLASLWITSTPNAVLSGSTNSYAYDDWVAAPGCAAIGSCYNLRRRLIVVGGNDGLLHAFDGGSWNDKADDPFLLPAIKTSLPPFNGYYDRGTGDEVWAFLPPDLISKVPLMLGGQHQFFVDGDPMVRDVWVDGGTPNAGIGGSTTADDVKQPNEFHTIVVGSERRGGTHYFALDVTDATKKLGESGFKPPRFLWIFPQPNSPEELEMGETYTGFLPNAPPIVPIRLDASTSAPAASSATPSYVDSTGATVKYHERWVVFLAGGFDPQYVRGHGVHVLDVWTGQELFSFSRPPDGSGIASTDPRWKLDAPIGTTVGTMACGKETRCDLAYPANGGFFDTATFGDTNGALWTLRFNDPGKIGSDADGRTQVLNWFGGRSFQLARSNTSALCTGRQPFFFMTANVPLYSSNRMYRVLAGTGDRYNLLDQYGGTCGPDNLRACMLRGCSVSVPQATNAITVNSLLGTSGLGYSSAACTMVPQTMASGTPGAACNSIQGRVEVDITNCANMDNTAVTGTSKSFSVDCSLSGGGASCAPTGGSVQSSGDQLVQSVALNYNNWYFSVRNFDDSGARAPFSTLAQAAAYDAARLTETDLKRIDGSSTTPATTTADSTGWAMFMNHDATFTDPVSTKTYNIAKADERTASPSSTPGDGCIYWNSVQPALLPKSAQCPCTVQNTDRLSFFYGANIAGGGLCLKDQAISGSGSSCSVAYANIRSVGGVTLTTPSAPQPTWFVNATGQVSVGLTSVKVGGGASNVSTGLISDAVRPIGWIPISRGLEACRHAGANPPPASACQE